jgi:hypothetical protein
LVATVKVWRVGLRRKPLNFASGNVTYLFRNVLNGPLK